MADCRPPQARPPYTQRRVHAQVIRLALENARLACDKFTAASVAQCGRWDVTCRKATGSNPPRAPHSPGYVLGITEELAADDGGGSRNFDAHAFLHMQHNEKQTGCVVASAHFIGKH